MRIRVMILLAGILLCGPVVGWAQVGQGRPGIDPGGAAARYYLDGRVVDERGAPVHMARVSLMPFRADIGQTTFTDDDGRFAFYNLRQGTYNLSVSASGYTSTTQGVDLLGGAQNIQLVLRRSENSPNAGPAQPVSVTDLAVPAKARELYQKGMKELERKKPEKSLGHFQAAINQHPTFAAAYGAMGLAYVQMRKTDLAREAFAKALELNEQLVPAQLGMGLICNDEKRFADAEKYLLKAQQRNPADWRVHYELGRAYYGLDQLEQAEKSLRLAREARPNYGNLYVLLANVLVLQNKYAEGLAELEEFLKVAPNSPLAPQVREKIKLLKAELAKH